LVILRLGFLFILCGFHIAYLIVSLFVLFRLEYYNLIIIS
jgi:hypothetical protein